MAHPAPAPFEPELQFEGKDWEAPRAFLDALEDWFDRTGLPAHRYCQALRRCLKDEAYKWFVSIEHQEWPLVRDLFLRKFDSLQVRAKLWMECMGTTQQPSENTVHFVMNRWNLSKRLAPELWEPERLDIIQRQMLPEARQYGRGTTFTSVQQLLEVAQDMEEDRQERRRAPRLPNHPPNPQTHHSAYPPRPTTQQNRPVPLPRSVVAPRPAPAPRPTQPREPAGRRPDQPPSPCHFCGGNHFNRDCPRRPDRLQSQQSARPATNNNATTAQVQPAPENRQRAPATAQPSDRAA